MRKKRKKENKNLKTLQKKSTKLIRQEYLDYDYLDKLNQEELEWLADFNAEYLNANVGKQSEAKKNRFHNTPELVKDCTDRNNHRNACIYGKAKARNNLIELDVYEQIEETENSSNTEDYLIELLDYTKKLKKANKDTNGKPE